MAKTFQFPVWLQGTPEQQAAEEQRQALLRASFTRAKLTEEERLIGRGALLEATARRNLEQSAGKNKEARILAENQLADAIADQGRYAEAAEIHNDTVKRKYFRDVGAAIELDDEEKCDCPDTRAHIAADGKTIRKLDKDETVDVQTEGGTEISVTPRFERARIYSPAHRGVVSLVECQKCGHLNARSLKSRLLQHNDALAKSEGAKRPVMNDAQVLRAAIK